MPQKNLPQQMTAKCNKQGSAGGGRYRPDKRGSEKEEVVLDWACPDGEDVNNDCAVALV